MECGSSLISSSSNSFSDGSGEGGKSELAPALEFELLSTRSTGSGGRIVRFAGPNGRPPLPARSGHTSRLSSGKASRICVEPAFGYITSPSVVVAHVVNLLFLGRKATVTSDVRRGSPMTALWLSKKLRTNASAVSVFSCANSQVS